MPLHPVITDWACPLETIAMRSPFTGLAVLYGTRWTSLRCPGARPDSSADLFFWLLLSPPGLFCFLEKSRFILPKLVMRYHA